MNTGLQDAYNLAWKLALVVKGQADAALLDSYEEERLPVAQRLLDTTDRAFRLVVSDSWLAGLLRTKILARIAAFAMSFERVQKARVPHRLADRHRLSQERAVAIAGRFACRRAAGRRPLPVAAAEAGRGRAGRGSVPEIRRSRLRPDRGRSGVAGGSRRRSAVSCACMSSRPILLNHANWHAPDIPRPSFYLVRPDGHVGLCGARFDADAGEALPQRDRGASLMLRLPVNRYGAAQLVCRSYLIDIRLVDQACLDVQHRLRGHRDGRCRSTDRGSNLRLPCVLRGSAAAA